MADSETRVYRFGLRSPTVGVERVEQQMRGAHCYRNALIEIERARRARVRAATSDHVRDLHARAVAFGEEVERLVAELRRQRQRTRSRSESAELRESIKRARATLKEAKRIWREARDAERPAQQAELDAANEAFNAARREARPGLSKGEDGLCAGTYQLVEEAVAQSARAPLWDGAEPNDPRYLRWTGEGAISQQIGGGGVSVAGVLEYRSTQVRITGQDEPDRRQSRRGQIKRRVQLWLRVGTVDRAPMWAQWPMIMHRPLPVDGQIKRVTVRRRLIGPRAEWCVEFVVQKPAVTERLGSVVAMDVGWRQTERGLRIAVTCDDRGEQREIVMPERIFSGLETPNQIRSTRDGNLDSAKGAVARWLAERNDECWIHEATATMTQWRAPARLAALVLRWRENRVAGDDGAFAAAEAWRKQDRHLWLWETSQRAGAIRARRDWFRCIAAELAEQHATLVLEKFDLRAVAQRQPAEAMEADNETSRGNRVRAAIGDFRQVLRSAFAARGGRVVEVDAAYTTRTCSECGLVEDFDAAAKLRHRCANGHEWDQDANAASNLIERWRAAPDPEGAREADGIAESRRERVRRKRQEKLRRMGLSQGDSTDSMAS